MQLYFQIDYYLYLQVNQPNYIETVSDDETIFERWTNQWRILMVIRHMSQEVDVDSEVFVKIDQNHKENDIRIKTKTFFLAAQKLIKNTTGYKCNKWIKGKWC
ncbi:hypothetical protein RCL_jg9240.t1 [Rhizophagus clarus]|uniref:Uncharacterized protein n=1 Tax=Rhizophagus clarus TaxID=94130 RepID=A0A8H3M9Y1_9GLOM|nr:hypothetical protein RCL_jg9240.t1 [Rhizophagus clarus]